MAAARTALATLKSKLAVKHWSQKQGAVTVAAAAAAGAPAESGAAETSARAAHTDLQRSLATQRSHAFAPPRVLNHDETLNKLRAEVPPASMAACDQLILAFKKAVPALLPKARGGKMNVPVAKAKLEKELYEALAALRGP